jgi:hypothetical protein
MMNSVEELTKLLKNRIEATFKRITRISVSREVKGDSQTEGTNKSGVPVSLTHALVTGN